VTYRLRRPAVRQGVGPLTVYRAIALFDQPRRQSPVRWVRGQHAFKALSEDASPKIATALARASVDDVNKVWTELAFEEARTRIAPDMPSRLDVLYAYSDPLEALSFTEVTGEPKAVWEGEVQNGVQWALVDVSVAVVNRGDTEPVSIAKGSTLAHGSVGESQDL
jgi:hypothetical protein